MKKFIKSLMFCVCIVSTMSIKAFADVIVEPTVDDDTNLIVATALVLVVAVITVVLVIHRKNR